METSQTDYIKSVVEALLFINDRPLGLDQMKSVLKGVGGAEIKRAITELMEEYEKQARGMVVVEIAGGYQMMSNPAYASYIRTFFKTRVKEKLSRPSLEALAIVAYKQPVSRSDIEMIRGVNSDGVASNLSEKGLIKIVGRKDVPGRPYIYGTTKLFLEYFGLKSLADLPTLEDFSGLVAAKEEEAEVVPMHDNMEVPAREEVVEATPDEESNQTQAQPEMEEQKDEPEENVEIDSKQIDEHLKEISSELSEKVEEASRLKEVMDEITKEETPQIKE